jgi:4-hydroxyacetophenone monooxygenase
MLACAGMVAPDFRNWDDKTIADAVACANLPTLLLALVHLTGDPSLIRGDVRPRRASPQRPDGDIGEAQAREIRERACAVLRALRDGGGTLPPLPSRALLAEMMSFSLGQEITDEYVSLLLQDTDLDGSAREVPDLAALAAARDFRVIIVGAGMSGVLAGIKLGQAGIPYTVLEKNRDLGGTWFENAYPGCRVDLPSHFYSFSFEPNSDWPEYFAGRDAVLSYLRRVASKYGVTEHVHFETEVLGARYDDAGHRWVVRTRDQAGTERELSANVVVSAVGQLNRPSTPSLPGLDEFAGDAFHTARWPRDLDLSGKRIGVIGTGASAMQVVPAVAPIVKHLTVFQRSAPWAIKNADYFRPVPAGKRWLLSEVPFYAAWYRCRVFFTSADGLHEGLRIDPAWPDKHRSINATNERLRQMLTAHIERELGDHCDRLRQDAVPDYPPFAKRMLLDNGWFRTLTRENVSVVREPIERLTSTGATTPDGRHHPLDVLVFATGFHARRFLWPMTIRGASGRDLHEQWDDDPRALLGMTVPGFPNFFCLYGPNTNLAHGGSIMFHSECQVHYLLGCLSLLLGGKHATIECTRAAHDAYNARVDAEHGRMIWSLPGVSNWFKNEAGRVTTNSPFRLVDYWAMTRAPDPADFVFA